VWQPPRVERQDYEARTRTHSRANLQIALYLAPLVALAGAAWAHRNIIDDGFIYLRSVHQVTAAHGPVFNIGERVESFTGPLWLAVLSVGDLLTPIRLEWLAVFLGIASTIGGVALAMLGAARIVRADDDALLIPFGALVLVVLTPMWYFASSGLETGLTFLWLGACMWMLGRWSTSANSLPPSNAVVLGLGWLVRPELVLYSVGFLFVVLLMQWDRDTWRSRLRLAAFAVALPAAYQLFRMGYYGALVANTAIAKEGTRLRWQRGWRYFLDFVKPYWFFVPFAIMLIGGYAPLTRALRDRGRRSMWVVGAFLVAGLVNAVYVVGVGGDYEHARLLLPSVFAICAPIAVIPATRRYLAGVALAPWVIAAALVLRAPHHLSAQNFSVPRAGYVTVDKFGWDPEAPGTQELNGPVLHVQQRGLRVTALDAPLAPDIHPPAAALLTLGAPSYAAGDKLWVLDLLGLADPLTARLRTPLYTTLLPLPGHEKLLPRSWIAARLFAPDSHVDPASLPSGGVFSLANDSTGSAFDDQVRTARATLQCPALKQLRRDTTAHLSIGRFFGNIVDSFSNTRLRIPPDPEAAYRKLCGARPTNTALAKPTRRNQSSDVATTVARETVAGSGDTATVQTAVPDLQPAVPVANSARARGP
jgi:arabinofuranosyltransferase